MHRKTKDIGWMFFLGIKHILLLYFFALFGIICNSKQYKSNMTSHSTEPFSKNDSVAYLELISGFTARLHFSNRTLEALIGRNGISNNKHEGDGTTLQVCYHCVVYSIDPIVCLHRWLLFTVRHCVTMMVGVTIQQIQITIIRFDFLTRLLTNVYGGKMICTILLEY